SNRQEIHEAAGHSTDDRWAAEENGPGPRIEIAGPQRGVARPEGCCLAPTPLATCTNNSFLRGRNAGHNRAKMAIATPTNWRAPQASGRHSRPLQCGLQ